MGNDSNIKRKHKQRTTIHKKHQVFPGMTISPEVIVTSGSIKPKNRTALPSLKETPYRQSKENEELWTEYDKQVKQLSFYASSATLQMRTNVEFQYGQSYRKLLKMGQINRIKKKYRL